MDGARLWEAQPAFRRTFAEICDLFDSLYLSFYKGIGAAVGAMLCGTADFIERAAVWRVRYGGRMVSTTTSEHSHVGLSLWCFVHRTILPSTK
jgi:threonine aldolase